MKTTELGPYNPRQPVPYIKRLTPEAVLTIGWDRILAVIEDVQDIINTKVAVDENGVTDEVVIDDESSEKSEIDSSLRRLNTKEFYNPETG